jgi:hypothetical protein
MKIIKYLDVFLKVLMVLIYISVLYIAIDIARNPREKVFYVCAELATEYEEE